MQICKFLSKIGGFYHENNLHKLTLFEVEIYTIERILLHSLIYRSSKNGEVLRNDGSKNDQMRNPLSKWGKHPCGIPRSAGNLGAGKKSM